MPVGHLAGGGNGGGGKTRQIPDLTDREREILDALTKGWSNKDIALALNIAEVTVKSALRNVLRKTGRQNRTDLALWWTQQDDQDMTVNRLYRAYQRLPSKQQSWLRQRICQPAK